LAPGAVRQALSRLSTYDLEFDRDLGRIAVTDFGDLALASATPADALGPLSGAVQSALAKGDALVLLGGDNSITRPGCHGITPELQRAIDKLRDIPTDIDPVPVTADQISPGRLP